MSQVDQFESVFKSADKTPFEYEPVRIRCAIIVTDLDESGAAAYATRVQKLLAVLEARDEVAWRVVNRDEYDGVTGLLELVETSGCDLVCAYRNLESDTREHPYSLGEHIDVLTQAAVMPVALLPRPDDDGVERAFENTDRVMAITDHLTGDAHLVSHAAHFTQDGGSLFLTHVEDQAIFDYYLAAISKIPSIDTEDATEEIRKQLLKEPHDYIASCKEQLAELGLPITVEERISLGHHLADHERHVTENDIDLLVMNTKDEDQLAMHGLAYPLAVQLRRVPLLML